MLGRRPSVRRAAFIFIFVTVLLDMLAVGLIIPVLPRLLLSFLEGNTAKAAATYGLFATVVAVGQFVMSPVLGALSDRVGRRPVILLSNLGTGLDWLVMAMAPTLGLVVSGPHRVGHHLGEHQHCVGVRG